MNKKAIIVISIIVVLAIVSSLINKNDANPQEKIKVGVIAPLTGDFSFYGQDILSGVKESLGEGYEIIAEDDMCEPSKAVTAFKKLNDIDNVSFIIGPACGSPQEAVAAAAKEEDVAILLPSAAPRSLFELSNKKVFNVQYSLEEESAFVASVMNAKQFKKVGLVTYNNAFSLTHAESFKNNFSGEIHELKYVDFNSDVDTEIIKARESGIDAFFVTDLSFFFGGGIERLSQNNFSLPVYSQYAVELPPALPLVEGVIYSFPADVQGNMGAPYEMAKITGGVLNDAIALCGDNPSCVRTQLIESEDFTDQGVRKQSMILKKINSGKPQFEEVM